MLSYKITPFESVKKPRKNGEELSFWTKSNNRMVVGI